MISNMPSTADLIFYKNKKMLTKLISDNYTILIMFCVVIAVAILILWYFGSNIYKTIKNYYKYSKPIDISITPSDNQYDADADNELYSTNMDSDRVSGFYKTDDSNRSEDYIRQSKKEFLEDIEKRYKDYNTAKSDYIFNTYNKTNDDIINKDILYGFDGKYDDYNYTKNHDEEYD